MTVHKSQGSEYDQVLLVLPEDAGHRLLTREIIYTGLTRAKYLVVTYGAIDALQAAIARHICRDSGLDLWSDV
jgi:exodeoxyribonuclease V alpha subunit